MVEKKGFPTLLALIIGCSIFSASLHAQLIEPTRSLEGASDGTAFLNVVSEPPDLEVQLDGKVIGRTPVFSVSFPPGAHVLRIRDSETDVRLETGKTISISWFKGSFIKIPEPAAPSAEIVKEPQTPLPKPKPDEGQDAPQGAAKDPYYWPLNPRGPIY